MTHMTSRIAENKLISLEQLTPTETERTVPTIMTMQQITTSGDGIASGIIVGRIIPARAAK